jgi:hypothetical protein
MDFFGISTEELLAAGIPQEDIDNAQATMNDIYARRLLQERNDTLNQTNAQTVALVNAREEKPTSPYKDALMNHVSKAPLRAALLDFDDIPDESLKDNKRLLEYDTDDDKPIGLTHKLHKNTGSASFQSKKVARSATTAPLASSARAPASGGVAVSAREPASARASSGPLRGLAALGFNEHGGGGGGGSRVSLSVAERKTQKKFAEDHEPKYTNYEEVSRIKGHVPGTSSARSLPPCVTPSYSPSSRSYSPLYEMPFYAKPTSPTYDATNTSYGQTSPFSPVSPSYTPTDGPAAVWGVADVPSPIFRPVARKGFARTPSPIDLPDVGSSVHRSVRSSSQFSPGPSPVPTSKVLVPLAKIPIDLTGSDDAEGGNSDDDDPRRLLRWGEDNDHSLLSNKRVVKKVCYLDLGDVRGPARNDELLPARKDNKCSSCGDTSHKCHRCTLVYSCMICQCDFQLKELMWCGVLDKDALQDRELTYGVLNKNHIFCADCATGGHNVHLENVTKLVRNKELIANIEMSDPIMPCAFPLCLDGVKTSIHFSKFHATSNEHGTRLRATLDKFKSIIKQDRVDTAVADLLRKQPSADVVAATGGKQNLKHLADDITNNKCPHLCGVGVVDPNPDGCGVIECSCKGFYCVLCQLAVMCRGCKIKFDNAIKDNTVLPFKKFSCDDCSRECHQHVKFCKTLLPKEKGHYYPTTDTRERVAKEHLVKRIRDTVQKLSSIEDMQEFWSHLQPHNRVGTLSEYMEVAM